MCVCSICSIHGRMEGSANEKNAQKEKEVEKAYRMIFFKRFISLVSRTHVYPGTVFKRRFISIKRLKTRTGFGLCFLQITFALRFPKISLNTYCHRSNVLCDFVHSLLLTGLLLGQTFLVSTLSLNRRLIINSYRRSCVFFFQQLRKNKTN